MAVFRVPQLAITVNSICSTRVIFGWVIKVMTAKLFSLNALRLVQMVFILKKKELSFRQLKGLCISVIQKFGSKTISGGWWSVQEIPIIMVKYSYLALQTY